MEVEYVYVFLPCIKLWLWLFFKIFFIYKYIKIIFFYILKIILDVSISDQKTLKIILI